MSFPLPLVNARWKSGLSQPSTTAGEKIPTSDNGRRRHTSGWLKLTLGILNGPLSNPPDVKIGGGMWWSFTWLVDQRTSEGFFSKHTTHLKLHQYSQKKAGSFPWRKSISVCLQQCPDSSPPKDDRKPREKFLVQNSHLPGTSGTKNNLVVVVAMLGWWLNTRQGMHPTET